MVGLLALVAATLPGCSSSNNNSAADNAAGGLGGGGASSTGGASTSDATSTGGALSSGGSVGVGSTTASAAGTSSTIPKTGAGGTDVNVGGGVGVGGATGPGVGGASTKATGGAKTNSGGAGVGGASKATGGTSVGAGGTSAGVGGSSPIKASGGSNTGGNAGTGGTVKAATGGTNAAGTGGANTGGSNVVTAPGSVYNGIQWADTSNNPIQAHGGGVIKVGDYYYWFGENRNPNGTFYAVSCYRSADLVHWEFRNNVLTQNSSSELKPANIERPKVIYNATTKKYVMWMHWENGSDYSASRAGVASSDTVDGNYTYLGAARPMVNGGVTDHGTAGYQSRDCTAFVDDNGKAYFLSAANENYDLNLYLLKDDYLSIDCLAATLFKGGHREAPALFKRNNVYFLVTSGATGWDPNQAQYATSSSLTSGWGSLTNVGDSSTFHSQSTYVVPVQGSSGTAFLYMGDRWAGSWGGPVNDSTYVWIPISFSSNTAMSMSWANTITIDVGAGTVTGATNKFKYVNKSSNLALSVAGTAEGDDAVQATSGSGSEQQWSLSYDNEGYFKVSNAKSSMVLDVNSSATTDGASVIQYTDNGGDNQKWRIVDKGAGYYQILNKNSNKVIEAPANSTTSGAALVQRAASANAANQLWEMIVP
jgi:hypothetical protein